MKKYLVSTRNLALAPLQSGNPRAGRIKEFDGLDEAKRFAEGEKENWNRVLIYRRHENDGIERLEHFQRPIGGAGPAQRYIRNKRIRDK